MQYTQFTEIVVIVVVFFSNSVWLEFEIVVVECLDAKILT